jgi:rare lipoprotein A
LFPIAAAPAKAPSSDKAPSYAAVEGQPHRKSARGRDRREDFSYDRVGVASWYGARFQGRRTASGEIYDSNAMTAAHPTLPFATVVRVTNLVNGRSVAVRINDRGPYAQNRIIDMSQASARALGFDQNGVTRVRVTVLREETLALRRGPAVAETDGAGRAAATTSAPPQPHRQSPRSGGRGRGRSTPRRSYLGTRAARNRAGTSKPTRLR